MKTSFLYSLAAALAVTAWAGSTSQAAIVVVAPTASTAGTLNITQDITFNVTTAGIVGIVLLDEWVTTDGSSTLGVLPTKFTFSVNGGANTQSANSSRITDNANFTSNGITPNDGFLTIDNGAGISVALGNTFTLRSGTFVIPATANFNSQATQTFNGNVFLADNAGTRLSGNVAVPEPTSALLGLFGGGCLLLLRRRRAL